MIRGRQSWAQPVQVEEDPFKVRLYLETNFLLSHAHGRDPATSRLIGETWAGIEIIFPSFCVMESLTNLEAEQKRINGLVNNNRALMNELGRNRVSPHAAQLREFLNLSEPEWEDSLQFFKNRLIEAIHWLSSSSCVVFLSIKPATLERYRLDTTVIDPTDGLILATILDDAQENVSATKVLVTENSHCFHESLAVRRSLQDAGVREYFPSVSRFLEWYDAQAES